MAMIVVLVTTSLVFAMILMVDQGLRASRRAGDSANALQVADAGINAAVQLIPTVPQSSTSVGPEVGTLGGGTYRFSASKVSDQVWNVSSVGRDKAGLERRVVAQAVGEPLFARPLYIRASATFKSGMTLDSYSGPETAATRCTRLGILTVNQPETLDFGGNTGPNCQAAAYGSTWSYSIDGCEFPGDESDLAKPLPSKNDSALKPKQDVIASSKCPPAPDSRRTAPRITPLPVAEPTLIKPGYTKVGNTSTPLTCDATRPLKWGTVYLASTLTMLSGCKLDISTGSPTRSQLLAFPVLVYAYSIDIGVDSGTASDNVINAPQASFCNGIDYSNPNASKFPVSGYCAQWVSLLRLNAIGSTGTVTFRNKARFFWGVLNVPEGQINVTSEQLEVWGAGVGSTMATGSGFIWHYDDSLGRTVGSGRFLVANWREEGTAT